jgi:hypothetical protein
MTSDVTLIKRRGMIVMGLCAVALLAALAGFVLYFKFGQSWGRIAAVVALVVGFGAQTWFVASLRRSGKGV